MALDMAKYRQIFLEESTEHLAEISRALFDLEKEMSNTEAIDSLFRMAHSIKSMAASLGYDSVADLSHRMEDRMEGVRADGRVRSQAELALLFRCLESLERMVAAVAKDEEPLRVDDELLRLLAEDPPGPAPTELASPDPVGGEPKKVLP